MHRAEENGTITSSKSRIIFVHVIIYLPFQCLHQWSGKWGRDEDEFLVKSFSFCNLFVTGASFCTCPRKKQSNEFVTDRKIWW